MRLVRHIGDMRHLIVAVIRYSLSHLSEMHIAGVPRLHHTARYRACMVLIAPVSASHASGMSLRQTFACKFEYNNPPKNTTFGSFNCGKAMLFIGLWKFQNFPSVANVIIHAVIHQHRIVFDDDIIFYCHFESRFDLSRFSAEEASLRAFRSSFRPSRFRV